MIPSANVYNGTRAKAGFLGAAASGDGPLIPIRGFSGLAKGVLYGLEGAGIDPGESLAVSLHNVADDDEATATGNKVAEFTAIAGKNDAVKATGFLQLVSNDPQTITVNGVQRDLVAGAPGAGEIQLQGSIPLTVAHVASELEADADLDLDELTYTDDGTDKIEIEAKVAGAAGNAITLAASEATVSGATLSGGADQTAIVADFEQVKIDLDNLDPAKPYLQAKIVKSASYAGLLAVFVVLGGYPESPIPAAA